MDDLTSSSSYSSIMLNNKKESRSLCSLPSETIITILQYLDPKSIENVASSCKNLRYIATSDIIWKSIILKKLSKSPITNSSTLSSLKSSIPPWDPSFGLVSLGRSSASREKWKAPQYEIEFYQNEIHPDKISLSQFKGANSFHHIYWTFIHHFANLLGWWLGDVPSYGMAIRIVFKSNYLSESSNSTSISPAFVCQRLHIVNRMYGSKNPKEWSEQVGFTPSAPISIDGTSIESNNISIDVSSPGIKTEDLWSVSWNDVIKHSDAQIIKNKRNIGNVEWRGGRAKDELEKEKFIGRGLLGQPSIVARARALASQMILGRSTDEITAIEGEYDEDVLDSTDETNYGNVGISLPQIVAASAVDAFQNGQFDDVPDRNRAIKQRNGNCIHTVYLSSGAICSNSIKEDNIENHQLSLTVGVYKPYKGADSNKTRAFGMKLSNFLPLPPIDFPPPALLPAIREIENDFNHQKEEIPKSSSIAFEDFLNFGTEFSLPILQIDPCPPYRPWPHLSQPMPTGIRFFPIESPPKNSLLPMPKKEENDQGIKKFHHPLKLSPELDPGSELFDWNLINGIYSMTYGPWGQELIYIRSRLLTIHDFAPTDLYLSENLSNAIESLPWARPTGPHGTGYKRVDNNDDEELKGKSHNEKFQETLVWQPEMYVDATDLELSPSQTSFIKPGCRVIEGVKCTGDANVPRGTVTFRAFSRGQREDDCILYYPPLPDQARHSSWNANLINDSIPGRILDCATGRLAMEGFINAGCWRRCSVKITSINEVNVYWHALHKVAVAKRLIGC